MPFPVVDSEQHLLGMASYSALLNASRSSSLMDVMERGLSALSTRASLEAAQHDNGWRRYDTLPVQNRNKQLVGVLRHVYMRDGLDSAADVRSVNPPLANSVLGSLGKVYLEVMVTSFGWLGDMAGRQTTQVSVTQSGGKTDER